MNIDSIAAQLLFSTVRIFNLKKSGVTEVGTGFIVECQQDESTGQTTPVIITNKHVVSDSAELRFDFTRQHPTTGEPMIGAMHTTTLLNPEHLLVGHPTPTVDVAVIPLWPLQQDLIAASTPIFYRSLSISLMPGDADEIDAIEEVTFIGYPDGHNDPLHGTPIVRRAITATHANLPFGGNPVFLIDGSVFGGSSGSPVLIFNRGAIPVRDEVTFGTRIVLIGVVAQTLVRQRELPLEVSRAPHTKLAQELNLGVVFNWRAIDETIDEFFRVAGTPRPVAPVPPVGTPVADGGPT